MNRQGAIRAGLTLLACVTLYWILQTAFPPNAPFEFSAFGTQLRFLVPAWFQLAALTPIFFWVASYSLTDLSKSQQYLQAGVRSLLIFVLAAALARPVATSSSKRVATIALVDVSASISDEQLEQARNHINTLKKDRPSDSFFDVVTFANRPRRAKRREGDFIIQRHDDTPGSNLQAAMQLAYALLPDGYVPRILLLSDGIETNGQLVTEAYRAKDLGVRLSWKTFDAGKRKEVRISSMKIGNDVRVGEPFLVHLNLFSTHQQKVKLSLRQDGFPNPMEPSKSVELPPGLTVVKMKSEAKRAGSTTLEAVITEHVIDTEPKNNRAAMTTPVAGKPHILYVEGGLLGSPGAARNFERALTQQFMDVEVRGPRSLPTSSKSLEKFDLVVISDVPAHFVSDAQMSALEAYVRTVGGGLLMAGGQDSFGSGGYQGTRMEKILPVRFDSEKMREQPNIAIALVIDRSGSMSGQKLEAAKESARVTTEVLNPTDMIGVIAHDSQPTVIVPMQKAANRMRISSQISRISAGGGTQIYPALREAYDILQPINAKVKHVIVLSDGQAPRSGIPDLCDDMRANKITISAVGIADADRNLLREITERGGGRLYFTDDLAALPRIFMKETTEAQKSALVEANIKAHIVKRVEAIEGTGVASAPFLHGYVSTKAKPQAETILISDQGEPLLARWKIGAGNSVAWTSDVKNRWASSWLRWSGFGKFFAQVIRSSMRRKMYDSYDLRSTIEDTRARVVVDAIGDNDKFVNKLETTLEIIDPKTSKVVKTVPMDQTAAGRYEGSFAIDRFGSYLLKAVHKREGKTVAESVGSVSLPYAKEYQSTEADDTQLIAAAEITGGYADPKAKQLFAPGEDAIEFTKEQWAWLLLIAMALLVIDIYLRRVRLFGFRKLRS